MVKLEKVVPLILAATLCLAMADACVRHFGEGVDRSPGECPTPPRCTPVQRKPCTTFGETIQKSYHETRNKRQIKYEHWKLTFEQSLVFVGWLVTPANFGRALVDGVKITITEHTGTGPLWTGIWTTNNVERAVATMEGDSVLLRVYTRLPTREDECSFLDGTDINNAVMTSHFCNHTNPSSSEMLAGNGKYIIGGPDGGNFSGKVLLFSRDFIRDRVKFLYSAHNKDIHINNGCVEYHRNNTNIEKRKVLWRMRRNIYRFFVSLKKASDKVLPKYNHPTVKPKE